MDTGEVFGPRERLFLVGALTALFLLYQGIARLIWPPPAFVRVQVVTTPAGQRAAEAWVEGHEGDHLMQRVAYNGRRSLGPSRQPLGVCIARANLTFSTEFAKTARVGNEDLPVSRYHLLVRGFEADSMNASAP